MNSDKKTSLWWLASGIALGLTDDDRSEWITRLPISYATGDCAALLKSISDGDGQKFRSTMELLGVYCRNGRTVKDALVLAIEHESQREQCDAVLFKARHLQHNDSREVLAARLMELVEELRTN